MTEVGRVVWGEAIEAVVAANVVGDSGNAVELDSILLDTGLALELMLDPDLAAELRLESAGLRTLVNADGSHTSVPSYWIEVQVGHVRRFAEAVEAAETAVGLSFFRQHRVTIDVSEDGRVTVDAI